MKIGVRAVVRKTLGMLRSLVGVGAHIRVCGDSSVGKSGRVCRRAACVCDVVIVLGLIGEDSRRVNGFVVVGSSKIHGPWGAGMSVAIHDAVGSEIIFVNIGLAGDSGRMQWRHSPAE